MRRYFYLLVAILGYLLLSSKSCSNRREENTATKEENLNTEKTAIKNEFTSEYLAGESLKAFESKAKQKLIEYSDYYNLLSNSQLTDSFRNQTKQMMKELFVNDATQISNNSRHFKAQTSFASIASKGSILPSGTSTLRLDSIEVSESLHLLSDHLYKGELSFVSQFRSGTSGNTTQTPGIAMKAEFFVVKISKTFGSDTLQVWNVSLGGFKQ